MLRHLAFEHLPVTIFLSCYVGAVCIAMCKKMFLVCKSEAWWRVLDPRSFRNKYNVTACGIVNGGIILQLPKQ